MKAKPLPDQAFLKACLEYDENTGILTWKVRPVWTFPKHKSRTPEHIANTWNSAWSGKEAFKSSSSNNYKHGSINGENYYAHRIIWKILYGVDPDDIDHEDGNRTNNKKKNLFDKSREDNLKNRALSSNNTSGYHGVSWHKTLKYWGATIYYKGKSIHLGWFKEKAAAIAARQSAEVKYGYHRNHGKRY